MWRSFIVILANRKRSISRALPLIFGTLAGTWRIRVVLIIPRLQPLLPTSPPPPHFPSVLRPSFRVLRPPISDLRPLYLNLTSYRLHLSLPPGIRHRDTIWYIFFEYLYLSMSRYNFIYIYIIYLNIENLSKHWFRNQNILYNNNMYNKIICTNNVILLSLFNCAIIHLKVDNTVIINIFIL